MDAGLLRAEQLAPALHQRVDGEGDQRPHSDGHQQGEKQAEIERAGGRGAPSREHPTPRGGRWDHATRLGSHARIRGGLGLAAAPSLARRGEERDHHSRDRRRPASSCELAELAVTSRRPVPARGTVTRMPVLRPGVAKPVAIDVAEIPSLARQDRPVAPGAVVEAGRDRGAGARPLLREHVGPVRDSLVWRAGCRSGQRSFEQTRSSAPTRLSKSVS